MSVWLPWKNPFGIDGVWVKDCGAHGDCLFLVLAEALLPLRTVSVRKLRKLAGEQVLQMSDLEYKDIVGAYRAEYDEEVKRKQWVGCWNPHHCDEKRREDLRDAIEYPLKSGNGFDFQGDHVIVDMLSLALQVNIVVFTQHQNYTSDFDSTSDEHHLEHPFLYTVFVLFKSHGGYHHYQLLGVPSRHVHGAVDTLFVSSDLPPPLRAYFDKKKQARQDAKQRDELARQSKKSSAQPLASTVQSAGSHQHHHPYAHAPQRLVDAPARSSASPALVVLPLSSFPRSPSASAAATPAPTIIRPCVSSAFSTPSIASIPQQHVPFIPPSIPPAIAHANANVTPTPLPVPRTALGINKWITL